MWQLMVQIKSDNQLARFPVTAMPIGGLMIIVHQEGTADCSRKNGHRKLLNSYKKNGSTQTWRSETLPLWNSEGELESSTFGIGSRIPERRFLLPSSGLLLSLKLKLLDHARVSCLDGTPEVVMQIHSVLSPGDKLTSVGLLEEIKNIQQIPPACFAGKERGNTSYIS